MAKTYTCTIPLKVRKQHTCVGCGAAYSYLLERKITGSSANKAKAEELAKKNFDRALAQETNLHPCPTCGLYQPDMVGQRRERGHRATFWIGLIALAILLVLRLADVFNAHTAAYVIAGACLLIALVHAGNEKNTNTDPQANRQAATDQISAGKLRLDTPGRSNSPADNFIGPPKSVMHRLALPLLLIAVALALSPEISRMAKHSPLNASFYPPVVGPGDTTRFYMPDKIDSIKGYWRGEPTVTLTMADGSAPIHVATKANQNDWGDTIMAKDSEKHSTSHPWLELTLPDDAALANKVAQAEMKLDVVYPEYTGSGKFREVAGNFAQQAPLHLAAVGAGAAYKNLWWEGVGLAVVLTIVAGLLLTSAAKATRATAIPTRVGPAEMPAAPAATQGAPRPAATV